MYSDIIVFFICLRFLLVYPASFRQGLMTKEVCKTQECHDAASHISRWMNPSFKPCQDFYEFTCGFWHSPGNNTEDPRYNISLGSRHVLDEEQFKDLLLNDAVAEEARLFKMLQQFFSLCLDEESIEARGVSPAVRVLQEAGGWPVLEDNWSEDDWDFLVTEIALGGSFFKINIVTSADVALIVNPTFEDAKVPLNALAVGFQEETVKEYLNMKTELAEAFGAERVTAETDMKEVVEFEIAMAELSQGFNGSDHTRFYNFSELQEDISWLNWTQLLDGVLPESYTLPPNATIYIGSPGFMREVGDLIKQYPNRTIANYMFLDMALSMAKYLPTNVRKIVDQKPTNKTRYDFCINILTKSSLSGVVLSYLASLSVEDTKAATEMTKNILDEFLKEIEELKWLDNKTRTTAVQKLNETKLSISYPEDISDLKKFDEDWYEKIKVNTSYFFEAVMDSNRNLAKSTDVRVLSYQLSEALSVNAYYINGDNIIGFLYNLPLFSAKVPAYVNYGHLGVVIAHELTHALDMQTDEVDSIQVENLVERRNTVALPTFKWESNETEVIYNEKKQCFIDQYSSFNDSKHTGRMLNGSQTEREDVADNGGFKLALRAYRNMAAKMAAPEPGLPTLQQYSPEQLFVISLANAFCAIPHKEKLLKQLKRDQHSPFEFRVNGMMMDSPDFGKMFDCCKGEPINPTNKCEVW